MKRFLALCFVFCICFGMTGCITTTTADDTIPKDTQATTVFTTEATTGSTEPTTAAVEQKALYAISLPTVTQAETAQDGTVILTQTYQNLSLIGPDPEVANNIIVDFYNRTDSADDAAQILENAKNAYSSGQTGTPYWLQSSYAPMRLDRCILSLYGSNIAYTGSAHAEVTYHSFNYDILTGSYLALTDILSDTANADLLCTLVLNALSEQAGQVQYYEGYEITVKERFAKDYLYDTDWYFSEDGLCFFFYPYDIAPYSQGTVIAQIPYSQLTGVLNDGYFPPEKVPSGGAIVAESFDASALDSYTQFAEILLSGNGNKVLLHTQGLLYNVRIETEDHTDENGIVYSGQTVFYVYTLSPGDAIMLESDFSKTALLLTYCTGSEAVVKHITIENNIPLLTG